jgi:hypothetical protein
MNYQWDHNEENSINRGVREDAAEQVAVPEIKYRQDRADQSRYQQSGELMSRAEWDQHPCKGDREADQRGNNTCPTRSFGRLRSVNQFLPFWRRNRRRGRRTKGEPIALR